jgi:hypothetical protein
MDRQRLMLMLMLMQAQQGRQGAQAQGQGPSQLDQALEYLKKGKQLYDDGKRVYDAGSGLVNLFSGPSYTPATQAAWNQAAGQASQQAWNAGADAATREVGGELVTDQASSSLGNIAGGLAGAYMAYKGGDQVLQANKIGGVRGRQAGGFGGLQAGLGAGLAINALGFALGPVGWAALIGGGALAGGLAGTRLGDKDMWKTEGKRLGKLIDKGIVIPEALQGARWIGQGRKTKDLINPYLPKDFVGATPQYGWVNNKFATSRDSKDLTARDIWGYSAFFDKYGNDWLGKFSEKQREDIANRALQRGAVKEHHGTIDINWTPELDAEVSGITGPVKIPKAPAPNPATPANIPIQAKPITTTNQPQRKGILGRIR